MLSFDWRFFTDFIIQHHVAPPTRLLIRPFELWLAKNGSDERIWKWIRENLHWSDHFLPPGGRHERLWMTDPHWVQLRAEWRLALCDRVVWRSSTPATMARRSRPEPCSRPPSLGWSRCSRWSGFYHPPHETTLTWLWCDLCPLKINFQVKQTRLNNYCFHGISPMSIPMCILTVNNSLESMRERC